MFRARLCYIESSRELLMPKIPRGVRAGVLADFCNDWESWQDLALGRLKGTSNFTHERIEATTRRFACSTVQISVVSDLLTTLASC